MERAQRAKLWSLSGGSVGSVGKALLNNIRIIVIEAKACFRNARLKHSNVVPAAPSLLLAEGGIITSHLINAEEIVNTRLQIIENNTDSRTSCGPNTPRAVGNRARTLPG